MKDIYNKHPTLPHYVDIWDINVLLAYTLIEKQIVMLVILSEQWKQILLAG